MSEPVRLSRGLWREPDHVATVAGRAAAYLSVCPEGSVIAGFTAARIHGIWLPAGDTSDVEIVVQPDGPIPRQQAYNRRPGLRARRQLVAPERITLVEGLPVTTEARTWLDLAGRLSLADLVAAGDSVLRGGASHAELELLVSQARRHRGVVRARQALPLLDARSRSRPESHLRFALVSSGLPKPAVNEPIYDDHGQWLAEPDLSYDDVRLALEYNGAEHAEVARMRRDITRSIDVGMRGGWQTVAFGPTEVFRFPHQIALYVQTLRRERARHLGLSGRLWA